jgi:hypothetical protein
MPFPSSPHLSPLPPALKLPSQPFHCSPLFKTLPKTSPLHGISKKRLQQRSAQPIDQRPPSHDCSHGMVLPKRVYQLQDDSFEQFKPTTGSPAALAMLQKAMRSPTSSRSSTPLNGSPHLSPLASPVISGSSFYGVSSMNVVLLPSLCFPPEYQDGSMRPD